MVPLVIVQTLSNTSPFWAALLAWCFIGEKMNPLEITALVVSFIGVCFIASAAHGKGNEISEDKSMYGLDAKML